MWKKENVKPETLKMREWLKTPEGIAYKKKHAAYMKERRKRNKAKYREIQKRAYDKAKFEALNHYCPEGIKCACCGETEIQFLSFDHINNDGAQQRKERKARLGYRPAGNAIFHILKQEGYPKDIQVLCMNCNTGKHRNGGICPHQTKKEVKDLVN